VLRTPGAPLDAGSRAFFEPRLGLDLSEVRVHDDAAAALSARALGALAYTAGRDIVFAAGRYATGTDAGRRLLAHELAHVVQQRGGPAVVQRQVPAPAHRRPEGEFDAQVKALWDALHPAWPWVWSVDKERIFQVLREARAESDGIRMLEYDYVDKTPDELEGDLREKLSGSDLDLALALLEPSLPLAPVPTAATYSDAAARLDAALHHRWFGADSREVLAVLLPFEGDFGRIGELEQVYAKLTGAPGTDALENDVKSALDAPDLDWALELLHGPTKVRTGMPQLILEEAERETQPGTPCTVASVVRYLRAYLDYWYFDGRLLRTEQLRTAKPGAPEVVAERARLAQELQALLGDDGAVFLDGGPVVANPPDAAFWGWLRRILAQEAFFGKIDGPRLNEFWQVAEDLPTGGGAPHALLDVEGRTMLEAPGQGVQPRRNIRQVLWDEVLEPGDVIQTWSTVAAASPPFTCPPERMFGGSCGHSFFFVEYVYAASETPPANAPRAWALIGATGTPLTTAGDVDPGRAPVDELKGVYLVGLRMVDQRGYHFIARNPAYNTKKVLPREVSRVVWLANSEVWFAGRP
jgi:hypothetical protein